MGRLPGELVAEREGTMHDGFGRWYMTNEDRLNAEQARLEGAVLDASMALYRKRTDASQRQWPEYEAWTGTSTPGAVSTAACTGRGAATDRKSVV